MSKPKRAWWGFAKNMIRKYPNNELIEANDAVKTAIEQTLAMPSGECRMKVAELVLMKQSCTIEGAAQKAFCSEKTARKYHWEFITLVGKNFKCESLLPPS